MSKDGFIFYKSFADAVKRLNDHDRLNAYDAIVNYALYGTEEGVDDMAALVLDLVKPQIDANTRRYENGKKGGRPKTPRKPQENPKETPTEPQENPKETPKEKKEPYGLNGNVKLTETEFNKLVNDFGDAATGEAIQFLDDYIADKNYKSKSNYSALRRWVFDAVKEQKQKQKKIQSIDEKQTADDWFKQRGFV